MSDADVVEGPSRGGDGSGWSGEEAAQAASGAGSGSADRLERRYRTLLMVLPKAYRASRGEEMLGVLMDAAPEGRRWPAGREAVSLAVLGIRVRSGARSGEAPTTEMTQPLLQAVALAGSLLFTLLAGLDAYPVKWHWSYFGTDINYSDLDGHHHTFTEAMVLRVLNLLWPAAYATMILAVRRTTYVVAALLTLLIAFQVSGMYTALAALPAVIVVVAMVLATRGGLGRAVAPGRWFAILGVLAGVAFICGAIAAERPFSHRVQWATVILPLLAAVVAAAFTARRSAAWPLALAVVLVLDIGLELDSSHHARVWPFHQDRALMMMIFFEGCLIAIAAYALIRERMTLAKARTETSPPA